MNDWQPIETCPDDMDPYVTCGTLVLVVTADREYGLCYGSVARRDQRYTHWMPLPEVPLGDPRQSNE